MIRKPPSPPLPPDEERSHKKLLDELAYLRAENAYLKKDRCLDPGETGDDAGQKTRPSRD